MKTILSLIIIGLLAGCSIKTELSIKQQQDTMKKLTYFKDKYNLCYAAFSNMTYNGYEVISITALPTNTPCDEQEGSK